MENQVKWHYKSPNLEELKIAIKGINNVVNKFIEY